MNLPYLQFYPADWLQDTRVLSLSAKGAWIDLLCAMWTAPARGRLRMRLSAYGRLIGATDERTAQIIEELAELGVAEVDREDGGIIEMRCRRMLRDAGVMEAQAEERKQKAAKAARARWGQNGPCSENAPSIPGASPKHCASNAIPETRVHTHALDASAREGPEPDPPPSGSLPTLDAAMEFATATWPHVPANTVREWWAIRERDGWRKSTGAAIDPRQRANDLTAWVLGQAKRAPTHERKSAARRNDTLNRPGRYS